MNNIGDSNEKFLITQQELAQVKYKHKNKCKDPAYKKLRNDIIFVCTKIEKVYLICLIVIIIYQIINHLIHLK